MSTALSRRARRSIEREQKRLERRLATDPTRPILRAAERAQTPSPSGEGRGEGSSTIAHLPAHTSSSIPQSELRNPHSAVFPLWATLLLLPPDLTPDFRTYLYRYIQNTINPTDDHEHWLASRIALAMARLHLHAAREADPPTPAWLRYESLTDRQLRQAHRDLKTHRATKAPTSNSQPATSNYASPPSPSPIPQSEFRNPHSLPNLPDPTFAPPAPTYTVSSRPINHPQTPPNLHDPNFAHTAPIEDLLHLARGILNDKDAVRTV